LNITEKEFLSLFNNRRDLWELLNTTPKSEGDFVKRYLPSKLWRMNNLYKVVNRDGDLVDFKMNRAQFIVHSYLLKHSRLIILKSRQQGISTYFLIAFNDDALFIRNLKCGLMAQGKAEASSLLERVQTLWDNLDPDVVELLNRSVAVKNTTERSYNNNSSMFIRTSFRSATLQRLHISEFGKIANENPRRARETKTGTLQTLKAGNVGAIESTAEGANDFKTMWDNAVAVRAQVEQLAGKDFLPVFLPWHDDPDCLESVTQPITKEARDYFAVLKEQHGIVLTPEQQNFWVAQYRELEGDIHQEYPATPDEAFSAAKDGSYWARLWLRHVIRNSRITPNLYDPALPVYVAADLGSNDLTVLLLFQYFEGSQSAPSLRMVGEYTNSGEFIGFYADYLIHQVMDRRGWDVAKVALPHDACVVDLSSEDRMTREDIFNSRGLTQTDILPKLGLVNSIESVRAWIPYMHIDRECGYVAECAMKYSKKWNEATSTWDAKPPRSEWNHGADAMRYMVQFVEQHLASPAAMSYVYETSKVRSAKKNAPETYIGI